MTEQVISLPQGRYFFRPRDQSKARPSEAFYVMRNTQDGYGQLKLGSEISNICLTMTEDGLEPKRCLTNDANQTFTITTNGRMYNYGVQSWIDSATFQPLPPGGQDIQFLWQFTTEEPSYQQTNPQDISLWNKSVTYPVDPKSTEGKWFNKPWSSTGSCNCNYSPTCSSNQLELGGDPCPPPIGFKENGCLWYGWKASDKELCATGSPSIRDSEKLDILKCKLDIDIDWCRRSHRPKPQEVWAPWSKATADTKSTINFCAQHDTLTDAPFINSYSNCKLWCLDNPKVCDEAKQTYCSRFPNNIACAEWCRDKECQNVVRNYCTGARLNEPVCKNWCSHPKENCDSQLTEYCRSIPVEQALKNEICGCFMPVEFMSNYFNNLERKGVPFTAYPKIPECYFAPCAVSKLWPFKSKQQPPQCPNVSFCFQDVNVDFHGNVTGNVTVDTKCEGYLPPPTPPSPEECKDPKEIKNKEGKCELCPAGKKPNPQRTECVDDVTPGPGPSPEPGPTIDCLSRDRTRPVYNPVTQACEACPSGLPRWNTTLKKCEACPSGYNIDLKDSTQCIKPSDGGGDNPKKFPSWAIALISLLGLGLLIFFLTRIFKRKPSTARDTKMTTSTTTTKPTSQASYKATQTTIKTK